MENYSLSRNLTNRINCSRYVKFFFFCFMENRPVMSFGSASSGSSEMQASFLSRKHTLDGEEESMGCNGKHKLYSLSLSLSHIPRLQMMTAQFLIYFHSAQNCTNVTHTWFAPLNKKAEFRPTPSIHYPDKAGKARKEQPASSASGQAAKKPSGAYVPSFLRKAGITAPTKLAYKEEVFFCVSVRVCVCVYLVSGVVKLGHFFLSLSLSLSEERAERVLCNQFVFFRSKPKHGKLAVRARWWIRPNFGQRKTARASNGWNKRRPHQEKNKISNSNNHNSKEANHSRTVYRSSKWSKKVSVFFFISICFVWPLVYMYSHSPYRTVINPKLKIKNNGLLRCTKNTEQRNYSVPYPITVIPACALVFKLSRGFALKFLPSISSVPQG